MTYRSGAPSSENNGSSVLAEVDFGETDGLNLVVKFDVTVNANKTDVVFDGAHAEVSVRHDVFRSVNFLVSSFQQVGSDNYMETVIGRSKNFQIYRYPT